MLMLAPHKTFQTKAPQTNHTDRETFGGSPEIQKSGNPGQYASVNMSRCHMRKDERDHVEMGLEASCSVSSEDAQGLLSNGIFGSRALSGSGTELGNPPKVCCTP